MKADPSDVILASIAAPPTPFSWTIRMPCSDLVSTPECPILIPSCSDAYSTQFFGDPAVRLAAVVGAAYTSQQWSMCDADYGPLLDGLAQKIIARLH